MCCRQRKILSSVTKTNSHIRTVSTLLLLSPDSTTTKSGAWPFLRFAIVQLVRVGDQTRRGSFHRTKTLAESRVHIRRIWLRKRRGNKIRWLGWWRSSTFFQSTSLGSGLSKTLQKEVYLSRQRKLGDIWWLRFKICAPTQCVAHQVSRRAWNGLQDGRGDYILLP